MVLLVKDYRRALDETSVMTVTAGTVMELDGDELARLLNGGLAVPFTKKLGVETR